VRDSNSEAYWLGAVVVALGEKFEAALVPGGATPPGSLPFLVGDAIKAVIAALVAAGVHRAWPGLIAEKSWPWRGSRAAAPSTETAATDIG